MKKILGLFVLIVMLNGCDDGKLTIDTVNFDTVSTYLCGETVYKLKDTEAIFMKIPAEKNAFLNDETELNTPRIIRIGGDVTFKYRFYDGKVTSDNICLAAGPIAPKAIKEWVATSGNIEITTTARYTSTDATPGQKKIAKYNHHIIIKNLVFAKPDGTVQKYDTFTFGDYLTDATSLALNFDPALVARCDSKTKIYNARNNGIESLSIENVDPNLIQNTGTITQNVSSTNNKLVYRLYNTSLPTSLTDYFCGTTPVTPTIKEEWIATEGTIEVVNTTSGGYLHTITLKKVTFKKGNSTFYYGDAILYGQLLLSE